MVLDVQRRDTFELYWGENFSLSWGSDERPCLACGAGQQWGKVGSVSGDHTGLQEGASRESKPIITGSAETPRKSEACTLTGPAEVMVRQGKMLLRRHQNNGQARRWPLLPHHLGHTGLWSVWLIKPRTPRTASLPVWGRSWDLCASKCLRSDLREPGVPAKPRQPCTTSMPLATSPAVPEPFRKQKYEDNLAEVATGGHEKGHRGPNFLNPPHHTTEFYNFSRR